MKKKVLYYDDWKVETTNNLLKVTWLPYDEDTSIGVKKSYVAEILQSSISFELEPELVAILFAAVRFNQKTVSPSNKCHKLRAEQITESLSKILAKGEEYEYEDILDILISAKTQDVEALITSYDPRDLIDDFLDK